MSNRSFEDGEQHWSTNAGAHLIRRGRNQFVFDGQHALQLSHPGGWAGQYFDMAGGRNYCFSAYAKYHGGQGEVVVGLKFWDAAGRK